jgi:hypothetical protein
MRGFVHITSEISNSLHEELEIFDWLYRFKMK